MTFRTEIERQARFKKEIEKRILSGESKIYPDRSHYFQYDEEYYYSNDTCTVYIKSEDIYIDLEENKFQELLRCQWNENRSDNNYTKRTLSYNNNISSDEDGCDEFIKLFEDENSPNPEQNYFDNNMIQKVKEAVSMLSNSQKKVIMGLFFENKNETELAKIMNMAQSTIFYHKKEGLKKLSKLLDETEFEF